MKTAKFPVLVLFLLLISSCGTKEKPSLKLPVRKLPDLSEINIPVDKGFSEYITGYTSGIIPANSPVEIRFTPEFAARANRKTPMGLFVFEPAVKGKAEWTDEVTLVFRPAKPLNSGIKYTGKLNLGKLAEVRERLNIFPIRIQTVKKDFMVTTGFLESSEDGSKYTLHGELIASDYIVSGEVEGYLTAKTGRKRMGILWNHSDLLIHKFTIPNITRSEKTEEIEITWDAGFAGLRKKGSASVKIPGSGEFSVIDILVTQGETQSIDIVFSDPVDPDQETEGLIWLSPDNDVTVSINANRISLFSSSGFEGVAELRIEPSLKNFKGIPLSSPFIKKIDFSPVPPSLELTGKGVILPASRNLIFPFKAANLKAVDLKIIKIFENNLPHFLQENEIFSGYSIKRFGRPVYSGKIDLINRPGANASGWNLYSVDLADYIDVEPGILYKVELSMRPSYSLYNCSSTPETGRLEELLRQSEEKNREFWDDPDNYYDDNDELIYYSLDFDWRDRDDPCKEAYFSPDKKVTRNIIASNFGMIAKRGPDNNLTVFVNDLLTALPLSEVSIEVFDYQLQPVASGSTDQNGSVTVYCGRKPFLIIARKDKDRNYLKINDGSSLSLSSFDVSGSSPENGIKAFIYGERDVWRPGDSIYLSLFVKDLNGDLPVDHPVQFELINPLEQKVDNQVQNLPGNRLMVFRTATAPDAVTGNYKAVVRIGGSTFSQRVRVETIKPNRLKIELDFPGGLPGGKPANGSLKVKWLNGSVAGNLKSTIEYIFKQTKTEFEKYKQYEFDDPAVKFSSETAKMFEGYVDGKGNASVTFSPGNNLNAPGMLNAIFTARVAEKGGDESITQTMFRYAPFPVFVGISLPALQGTGRMLFTDTDNEVKVVTVDHKGNPVSSKVELTLYKLSYRWWWESDEENLASFISNEIYKPALTKTITTTSGEGSASFNIDKSEWGRYLIRASVPGGHATGKIILIDWPWEYGLKNSTEGATLLTINTDKEKYAPGEEVKLTFSAPENARAIVTLENATSVIDEIRIPVTKGTTVVSFRAKPEMAPNVYAYVTVIQPHAQTVNDMPMRLYGIVPVMIEDPETRLKPVISMPEEVRSKTRYDIRVTELTRKPMTYTLAIVDEGLLGVTGYRTPDPWKYFYAREALGIQTWDLYDYVLGAFGGTLERLFATGGDETVIDHTANKAERFIPVVKFLGPFTLGPGKTGIHSVTLPQYTGSVRTMVIAGNGRAFGFAEKNLIVKDPLMILVTAPRVVSPGEKVSLPVTLFVQKDGINNIAVNASGNELISFSETSKNIQVTGQGETDTEFVFMAGEKPGVARIRVTATGGGETSEYELELEIRSPNPPETRSEMKILEQGEKWQNRFTPFGIEGSNGAFIEITTLPSVNLEKRLGFLLDYPHGCTEQVTSAAFPQLWLKDPAGSNDKPAEKTTANIRDAITTIASRQMNNGGVALWPGTYQPDNWVTSYSGHFMTEAERKGFSIPAGFKQKWLSYQRKTSQEWRFDPAFKQSANDQAYRLLTLALAGHPEKGAMNRMRESEGIPRLARWFLAAAFATTGRTEVAGDLLNMRDLETEREYYDYYYGSYLRDQAVILYTLTILNKQEEALPLLKTICDNLNKDTWYSTQSLAWSLFSYMKFAESLPEENDASSKVSLSFNGEKSELSVISNQIVKKELKMKEGNNLFELENRSGKPVYANLVRKGVPLVSDNSVSEKGLSMKVDYLDMDLKPVNKNSLEQGRDFMMVVRITNKTFTSVGNIALTQMVPSGWEIRNTRLFEAGFGIKESSYDYRDIRDDRVNTYFGLSNGETKTFLLILNAAYKGEFFQPSVWCEAMYTENCYSGIPGGVVKVTGQNFE